jgi:hypothetical protein
MTEIEKDRFRDENKDMWLLYPPLSGKHLKVQEGVGEREIELSVMRKETLKIEVLEGERGYWLDKFDECIGFGNSSEFRFPSGRLDN